MSTAYGDTYRSMDDDDDDVGAEDASLSLSAEESIDAAADRDERRAALLTSMSSEPSDTYIDDGALSDEEQSAEASAAVPMHLHRRYTCGGLARGCLLSQSAYATSLAAIVLVSLAVIIAVLLAAVLPYVVAGSANSASISVSGVSVSSRNDSSVVLSLTATLADTGALTADVAAMTVAMSLLTDGGTEYVGSFNAPAITLSGGGAVVAVNSTLSVSSDAAFASFVRAIVHDKTVGLKLSATAAVTPYIANIALPQYTDVDFTKTVTLAGADGLRPTRIADVKMNASTEAALTAEMNVLIVNPSDFQIAPLGRISLALMADGQHVADVRSLDVVSLVFGNSTIAMSATFDNASAALNGLFVAFFSGAVSNVTFEANENATDIAVFSAGLNGTVIASEWPPYDQPLISDVTFANVKLAPNNEDLTLTINANTTLTLDSPFGDMSPFNVETIAINATLNINAVPFASFTLERTSVRPITDDDGDVPTMFMFALNDVDLTLLDDGAPYQTFIASLFSDTQVPMSITAVADMTLSFVAGALIVPALLISTSSPLAGMSGLNVNLSGINLTAGADVNMVAAFSNPSDVTLTLGAVNFSLSVAGESVTVLSAESLNVTAQSVERRGLSGRVSAQKSIDELSALSTLLSGILTNRPTDVRIAANVDDADLSALALTLAQMNLSATTEGQGVQIIPTASIDRLNIDFAEINNDGAVAADAHITAAFILPPNIALNTSVDHAALRFAVYSGDGFANFNSDDVAAVQSYNQSADGTDLLSLAIPPSPLRVNDTGAFQRFAQELFTSRTVNLSLVGTSDLQTPTQVGRISINDVPTVAAVTFSGFNQFLDDDGAPLVDIRSIKVIGANATSLTLAMDIAITNPSAIALSNVGTLRLDLLYNDSVIAHLTLPNVTFPSALASTLDVIAYVPLLSGVKYNGADRRLIGAS